MTNEKEVNAKMNLEDETTDEAGELNSKSAEKQQAPSPEEAGTDKPDDFSSEMENLKKELEQLKSELDEKENRLLRVQADFDNYRKRVNRDLENYEKYKSQKLAEDLLETLDNFERALNAEINNEEAKAVLDGMKMVYRGILDVFKKHGIEPFESLGKPFDPHFHHAVMQGQNEDFEPNTVIEVLQKGYIMKDRVIRPAMVKVNQ